jgi:putative tricarboxylic transport membrane protein
METRKMAFAVVGVLLFTLFVTLPVARAADYPDKPLEVIVHSAPGGGSDLFARQVAAILDKEGIVKQKIQVVNRTGGGATVALNYLADKKGDAYAFMNATTGPLTTVLRGSSRIKFEDLVLIAMLAEDPNLAFTRPDSPFKSMKDVIAEAKKAPKKVNVAVGTIGGSEHICAHRVAKATGVEFNIVTFKSGGDAAIALLGGHVDLSFGTLAEQMGQIEAKKIKGLAAMGEKRIPFLADVPTMKEEGINVVFSQFRGFWAAPDFPDYAVKYWEETFEKLLKSPTFKAYLQSNQAVESFLKHEDFKKYLTKYSEELMQDVKALEAYQEKKQ